MSSTRRRLAALSLIAFALTSLRPANAELVLEFGRDGVPGVETFSMVPGSSLEIDLFLTQKRDLKQSESGPVYIEDNRLTEKGLSLAEFTFTIDRSGLVHGDLESVQARNGLGIFLEGARRENDQSLRLPLEAPFNETDDGFEPVFPASGEDSIWLATATVELDPAATGVFQLQIAEPSDEEIFFNIGSSFLSGFVPVTSGTATVTAVPEPSALLGIALASGLALGLRRYRSRGRRVAAAPWDLA